MTSLELITASLRLIGVASVGEALSANEANDGLTVLNDMLDLWSTQKLLIPATLSETFPVVPGQQTYTMGVGGNFNTSRPMSIENAVWQQTTPGTTYELPIDMVTQDQWVAIGVKGTSSNISTKLYVVESFPLFNLLFWPIPLVANNVVLWSTKPLSNLAATTTIVTMPPGYSLALKYNLAVLLAPEYGKNTPAEVLVGAEDSKAAIKRMNTQTYLLGQDAAVLPKRSGFNYLTGE